LAGETHVQQQRQAGVQKNQRPGQREFAGAWRRRHHAAKLLHPTRAKLEVTRCEAPRLCRVVRDQQDRDAARQVLPK